MNDSLCCYVAIIVKHKIFLFNSSNLILTVFINMHLNKFCEPDTRSWMMIKSCQVEWCFCILSSPQRYNTNPTNFLTLLPTLLNGKCLKQWEIFQGQRDRRYNIWRRIVSFTFFPWTALRKKRLPSGSIILIKISVNKNFDSINGQIESVFDGLLFLWTNFS